MQLRNIPKKIVIEILNRPIQIKDLGDFKVYKSLEPDKKHLIRIFVNANLLFLTVYRTSKIKKYYEAKI
jgi:hypothetical protein